jgi:hypothetical protein
MFSILAIINRNIQTYYDFATDKQISIIPSLIVKLSVSFLVSLFIGGINPNFLSATISSYAVLTGFSFSIIFFLISSPKYAHNKNDASLERALRSQKLNKIKEELFYNISYFNISAIFVIIFALLLSLLQSHTRYSIPEFVNQIDRQNYHSWLIHLNQLKHLFFFVVHLFFYFLVFESLVTLLRVMARVNFYFQERIKLETDVSDASDEA